MCGIAGIFDFHNGRRIDRNCLQMMIDKIHHRGPDGTGFKVFKNVGLAHARLSIIDLETGNQPIHNETQDIWTVFNGEIFNYIELRDELIKKGHRFSTKSDTEVIVHLYEEFGDEFVNHLNGQFAISLFDIKQNRMLLIRDRIGIAPLYYTKADSRLYFASEIKSLLMASNTTPSMNHNVLDQIFTFWSPVSPETVFSNIFEVSPGEMLIIENGKSRSKKYWDWDFPVNNNYSQDNEDLLVEQLKEHMINATKIRLRSDVPVGAYLSGGLDSSTIVSLINNYTDNKLRTFSIGFEDQQFDETDYQNELIKQLNTEHSYFKCSNTDIVEMFIDTIWHTESPILRTAPVPMRKLSRLVKDNNYKVVLTGEGADEVLGGYDIFKEAKIRHFWSTSPGSLTRPLLLKRLYPYLDMSQGNAFLNAFFGQGIEDPNHFSFTHLTRWSSTSKCKEFFSHDLVNQITNNSLDTMAQCLPNSFKNWHYFSRAQYLEAKTLMSGYLLCSQGDRMLMSNAVEGRFPFLDHKLIEFANQIHPKNKMKGLNEKYLLKKSMYKDLPSKIVARHKQPYRAPDIVSFYNNDKTSDYVNTFLGKKKLSEYGYFESDKVERLIKKIRLGRTIGYKDNMSLIGILSTQIWHYHFIEKYTENFIKKV